MTGRLAIVGILVLAAAAAVRAEPPAKAADGGVALRALDEVYDEVAFRDAPLREVIDWISEASRLNIVVRWRVLHAVGIEPDTPIDFRGKLVTLRQILWMTMNACVDDERGLAYLIEDDVLLISTAEDLGKTMIVATYEVSQLVQVIPNFARDPNNPFGQPIPFGGLTAPSRQYRRWAAAQLVGARGATAVDMGEESRRTPPPVINDPITDPNTGLPREDTADEKVDELIWLITHMIEPESWSVNGGKGEITSYNRILIVRNNPLVQQQVAQLLGQAPKPQPAGKVRTRQTGDGK